MGLLRRIADRFDPPEQRAADPSWAAVQGIHSGGGSSVDARLAENLGTVLACVNAISGAVATLPVYVYRRDGAHRDIAHDHDLMRLYRNGPNEAQTWACFTEWIIASTLLRGNGLAEIRTDNAGRVVELRPIPWEHVAVHLLPTGRLAYDVSDATGVYGGTGRVRRLLQGEVIHLRDRSDDGLLGRSRLQRAAAVVSNAHNIQAFSEAMWHNQATPQGVLEHPGKLSPDALRNLRETIDQQVTGTGNARRNLVLEEGMSWKPVSLSAEDAELLASRRFTVEELARLYQVPPPIIGDLSHGTFTNSETVGRWFAQQTLSQWIAKLEAELTRRLLGDGVELEIDLTGMLRGDPETRWSSHEIAVRSGILTPNEVREAEGWNPREDADVFQTAGADN